MEYIPWPRPASNSCDVSKMRIKNEHISRPLSQLSGGEQAKVRLCKLMGEESNWLLFDEPTNHLDVTAKEELKKAMKAYKGTILLVCHEPEFYKDWITKVWDVEEWAEKTTKLFPISKKPFLKIFWDGLFINKDFYISHNIKN